MLQKRFAYSAATWKPCHFAGRSGSNMRLCPPKGPGLFLRSLHGKDPTEYGMKLVVSGFCWAIIGGPWHGRRGRIWVNSPDTIRKWTIELTRLGLKVYVWGYPDCDQTEAFIGDIQQCLMPLTRGVVLDPELEEKVPGKRDRNSLLTIIESIWDYANIQGWDGFPVALSSWGDPRPHRDFPWEVVQCCDWIIPQLYLETSREHSIQLEDIWLERAGMTRECLVPGAGSYKTIIVEGKRTNPSKSRAEFSAHYDALGRPATFAIWSDLSMTDELFSAVRNLTGW